MKHFHISFKEVSDEMARKRENKQLKITPQMSSQMAKTLLVIKSSYS